MSGAEIVFPILTETKKQKKPLCSHLSDLIVRVVLKGVGIVSRTPAWLNLMSSMPSTEETTGTKANTDTKSTCRVWRHLCSLIFVTHFLCDVSFSRAFRWRAANYSQFYGMTLDEGIRYRLGTQRPSKTIMNMNEIQVHDSFLFSNTSFEIKAEISRYFKKFIKSMRATVDL